MKPLDELLKFADDKRKEVYAILQTQDFNSLSILMGELASFNFSISYYVAQNQFEADSLAEEIRHKIGADFIVNKDAGDTDKLAEMKAKNKWSDLTKKQLEVNKEYRLASLCHKDIETLIDVLRSRVGVLRKELDSGR